MLCVHFAIRALMCRAAEEGELDPDRLSFTRSMRAARRSVRRTVGELTTGLSHASAEILHELLPHRRLRANPRVVRRKMSNYNLKRPEHRSWPQPTRTTDRQSASSELKLMVLNSGQTSSRGASRP